MLFHARTKTSAPFVSGFACKPIAVLRVLIGRARRSVRADFVNADWRAEDCPPYPIDRRWLQNERDNAPQKRAASSSCLFQLALSFLRKVQVFLNHFCRIIRELLYVGIAPAVCFLFEFSQIFFMILHHHVDISFV